MAEQLKLLIVEDDPDQFELMRETLEDRFGKATVSGAVSMRHALSLALEEFDLILCDYNLPDGTGLELLEKARARCDTPVLMVTGENVGDIATEAVRRGAMDYVVKYGEYLSTLPLVVEKNLTVAKIKRENELLREELELALAAVREKNMTIQQSLKRVEELAATDPLTGLCNRRHFGELLDRLFAESARYDREMSCVMIDLDGYKQINDEHGHQIGDQLLVLAGRVILGTMRKMDVAARYGGDEFVILLPGAGADKAMGVAQRIREELSASSAQLLGKASGVGMSAGVSSISVDRPGKADDLVARADRALYKAKAAGRNRTVFSDGSNGQQPQAA